MEIKTLMLGEKIKNARLQKDLSQRQVTKKHGVSQPSYLEWKHGDSIPNWARMKAIAHVIEISLEKLAIEPL